MRTFLVIIVLTLIASSGYSQKLRLSDIKSDIGINYRGTDKANTTSEAYLIPILVAWPFNPMVVVENKKAYFALTKEISIILPRATGKAGFEYSYVFRSERNHHLRVFADYFFPIEAGNYALVLVNAGGGYFTDTKKSGLFPQVSLSILAPMGDLIAINLYVKVRQTFMLKKEEADIFDSSLGIGLSFHL